MIFPGLNLKYQYLKQYIHSIKKLIKRQRSKVKDGDKLSLRMELDKSDYYLKLIANDKNNIFRVFSDALYFSQSYYKEVKNKFYSFIQNYANIFKNLLKFIGSNFETAEEYLEEINRGNKEPEITLTMLSFIYGRNLVLLYSDENFVLKKYKLEFGFTETVFVSILDNSGNFDSVYTKEHINLCGMTQSLLLEILGKALQENDEDEEISQAFTKKTNFYI